jgi:hypothetical protein
MKKAVFWDVAPGRCGVNRRLGGTYRLHLQGRRKNKKILTPHLHGATSQKTAFFIVTAVKTPNIT